MTSFVWRSYYWQTRQWQFLKQGAPAVAVAAVILGAILLSNWIGGDNDERYRVAFNLAVKSEDYETAYLFRRKLEAISGPRSDDLEFRFNCALADIGRGQTTLGLELIDELAPEDSFGYGPAHLWVARQQINQDPSMQGENGDRIAHHLNAALREDPKNHSIHYMLGRYHEQRNNKPKAIEHLTIAAESHSDLHFVLGGLNDVIGNFEDSQKHFELAKENLRGRIEQDPDNIENRVNLGVAIYKTGKFDDAIRTLVEALAGAKSENEKAHVIGVLSAFYLSESDRLRQNSSPNSREYAMSLLLLAKSLEFAPNNEKAINRIAEIAALEGTAADQAIETLKELIVAGKMTATAHVILGTAALKKGDQKKAKMHFGLAYRLDPKMPTLLNNVAWMLAHQDPAPLGKALAVINQALEAIPRDHPLRPAMLDTRGQIYVKMERWEEALVDLEQALTKMRNNRNLHRALAETYRALGQNDLAEKHDRLSGGGR